MNQRQSLIVQGMSAALVLASIIAVTLLGLHGTIDGESVVAVLGTAIGFAGANVSGIGAVAQAVNGKAVVSDSTLRHAMDSPPAPSPEQPGQR